MDNRVLSALGETKVIKWVFPINIKLWSEQVPDNAVFPQSGGQCHVLFCYTLFPCYSAMLGWWQHHTGTTLIHLFWINSTSPATVIMNNVKNQTWQKLAGDHLKHTSMHSMVCTLVHICIVVIKQWKTDKAFYYLRN